MGVATGCGFKEIYRFPHTILIPTPLVSVLFGSSIPTSFFILLKLYIFKHFRKYYYGYKQNEMVQFLK